MQNDFIIERATIDDLSAMKNEWTELLDRYKDATLFNTWEWQYTWWRVWGDYLKGELYLILVKKRSGDLVGIAPLYKYRTPFVIGKFKHYKMQFIGSSATISNTVRSEYLDFIYDSRYPIVVQALLKYLLSDMSWSKVLFSDIRTNSILFEHLTSRKLPGQCYIRAILKDIGVKIDTTGLFENYKKCLGRNIRLESFNRRGRLESQGQLTVSNSGQFIKQNSINLLNAFHKERWGKECFNSQAQSFHLKLSEFDTLADNVKFSEILLDDKPLSIIYNIDYKGVRYNIQLGFTESGDKKLSMGCIQLGYAIEDAFSSPGVNAIDLLAGSGKKTFYKNRYKGDSYRLYTLEIIRSPVMRFIYKLYDICKYFIGLYKL